MSRRRPAYTYETISVPQEQPVVRVARDDRGPNDRCAGVHVSWRGRYFVVPGPTNGTLCPCGQRAVRFSLCHECIALNLGHVPPPYVEMRVRAGRASRAAAPDRSRTCDTANAAGRNPDEMRLLHDD